MIADTLLIRNATVVFPDRLLPKHSALCRNGKIEKIAPDIRASEAPNVVEVDAAGCYLAPGFIDLHIHGTHRSLVDNGPDDLAELCRVLPQYGVTALLPTVCPRPKGEDAEFLSTLARVESEGAHILGFHLEGPFLSLTGALPPEAIGSADPDRVMALQRAAEPHRAIFSIAPDFPGILDLIPIMNRNNTPVFMTHTAADVKQTQAAIDAGARHATHFYDVFPAPPITEPGARPCGVVETALADERVSVDFILDGEHVDPVAVKLALLCKAPDRICLITDANIGAGLAPGRFMFAAGMEIEFKYCGGPARLTETSYMPGALAGSGLTLDRALRNAVQMLRVDLPQAVRMVSANPAKTLGLDHVKGCIKEGYDADLVLLDENLTVVRTWINGQCRWTRG